MIGLNKILDWLIYTQDSCLEIGLNAHNILPLRESAAGFLKSSASNKSSSDIVSELLLSKFHAEMTLSFASEFSVTLSLVPT